MPVDPLHRTSSRPPEGAGRSSAQRPEAADRPACSVRVYCAISVDTLLQVKPYCGIEPARERPSRAGSIPQLQCSSAATTETISSRFFGIFLTGLPIAGAGDDAYSRCSPLRRPGLATWNIFRNMCNCYIRQSVYLYALCFMAAVRGRSSGLPGSGNDRFANPRTAATCFCLATKTAG